MEQNRSGWRKRQAVGRRVGGPAWADLPSGFGRRWMKQSYPYILLAVLLLVVGIVSLVVLARLA